MNLLPVRNSAAPFPSGPEILVMLRSDRDGLPVLAVNRKTGELCLDRTHFTQQESEELIEGIRIVVHAAFDALLATMPKHPDAGKGFGK